MSPKATGTMAAPAWSAEYPCASCRYCVVAKIAPKSEKNAIPIAADATLKRGLRKNESWSIGSAVRSSQRTNAVARTAAATKHERISGFVHPCSGASITP